jgi:hypothetical protein
MDKNMFIDQSMSQKIFYLKTVMMLLRFYFETVQIVNNLEPKEILSLEKILRSSKFYNEN